MSWGEIVFGLESYKMIETIAVSVVVAVITRALLGMFLTKLFNFWNHPK